MARTPRLREVDEMGGRGQKSASGKKAKTYHDYIGDPVPFDAISRKQGGMIFGAYKRGDIQATKQQMSLMYERYVDDGISRPSNDATAIDIAGSLRTTINALSARDVKAANGAFQQFLKGHYMAYKDTIFPDDRKKKK